MNSLHVKLTINKGKFKIHLTKIKAWLLRKKRIKQQSQFQGPSYHGIRTFDYTRWQTDKQSD